MPGPGEDYVTFAELITEAHKRGFIGLSTQLLDYKMEDGKPVYAIVSATASFESGVFEAIGDATRENTNRGIGPHLVRMASTRAMARALRVALGVGKTAIEELGGSAAAKPEDETGQPQASRGGAAKEPAHQSSEAGHAPMKKSQKAKIEHLAKQCRYKVPDLTGYTEQQAQELIDWLEEQKQEREAS